MINKLKEINFTVRLSLGFLVILTLFTAVTLLAISRMNSLAQLTVKLYSHPLTVSNAVQRINTNIIKIHRTMKDVVLAPNIDTLKKYSNIVDILEKDVYKDFNIIRNRFLGKKESVEEVYKLFTNWQPIRSEVIKLKLEGYTEEAKEITIGKGAQHVSNIESAMEKLTSFAQNKASEFINDAKNTKEHASILMYFLLSLAIIIGITLAILITYSITHPINTLKNTALSISRGKLNTDIPLTSTGEIGQLAIAFKKMVNDLITQQEDLRLQSEIISNMPEGVFLISANDHKIVYCNPRFEEMFGYEQGELIGKEVSTVNASTEKTPKETAQNIIETLNQHKVWQGEVHNIKKDGTKFWCYASVSSLNHYKYGLVWVSVHTDITERKKAQEQLQQQEQLLIQQSKLSAMGEMISAIAHQWRQPLNTTSFIMIDIIDACRFNELNYTYLKSMIDTVLEQIQYMSKTIDDFRNFFKPSKEKELFDVDRAIQVVRSLISKQFESNNIIISYENKLHKSDLMASGYPNEFKQVVINLLQNAKDAIAKQKKTADNDYQGIINIELSSTNSMFTISLKDNGSGIPEDVIERIFDPYYTTKEQGTGIGLYMSKMIIENNMEGKLYCENTEDGAAFHIELKINS